MGFSILGAQSRFAGRPKISKRTIRPVLRFKLKIPFQDALKEITVNRKVRHRNLLPIISLPPLNSGLEEGVKWRIGLV